MDKYKKHGAASKLNIVKEHLRGEIISYSLSESPNFKQVSCMLDHAFKKIGADTKLILHSDQGWQYQMKKYQSMPKEKE